MNDTKTHAPFATAPRGLEPLLAGAYRACLWPRIANRIMLRLAAFEAVDERIATPLG